MTVQSDCATLVQVAVRVPIGSVMLWRSSLLHAVAPHLSRASRRYHIHISYTPRWVRPTGYEAHDPELLARSSPVRLELDRVIALRHYRRSTLYAWPTRDLGTLDLYF